jgi:hypothetical protein
LSGPGELPDNGHVINAHREVLLKGGNLFILRPEPAFTLWFALSFFWSWSRNVCRSPGSHAKVKFQQNSLNKIMEFQKLVEQVLIEDMMIGGSQSVMGPAVVTTATEFSGDNYAKGDARVPASLYGGILTRGGTSKRKRNKRKKSKQ